MVKAMFAVAAGLLVVTSPVLAAPAFKHMHRHAVRAHRSSGDAVVSSGSDIRITSSGEVIAPKTAIVSVPKQPPPGPLSKGQGAAPADAPAAKP